MEKEMPIYAAAFPHDPIQEIFPDVFVVYGSIRLGPAMRMSRNMVILRAAGALTLINPVRLNEAGLASLEALGQVRHIMRLGDFHGLDDAFYRDRYQAEFWCQPGQTTYPWPNPSPPINAQARPPIPAAEFFIFETAQYPEAALLLTEHKLLITTDSVQYWLDWRYTSWFTRGVLRLMGFTLGLQIGGPWLKRVTPKTGSLRADFDRILSLDFDHLLAAHGSLCQHEAKRLLATVVDRAFGSDEQKARVLAQHKIG